MLLGTIISYAQEPAVASDTETAPAAEESELGRRFFETGVLAGPTFHHCAENDCEGDLAAAGFTMSFFGAVRPIPWFSAGLFIEQSRYGWHAQTPDFDAPDESMHMTTVAATARFYPLTHGWPEPWLGVGLGIVGAGSSVSSKQCDNGVGPIAELTLGFDGYVAPWLRLSSALFAAAGRTGQSCNDVKIAGDAPPTPTPTTTFGLRLGATFGFGDSVK